MLDHYCRALAGREISVAPCSELIGKNVGWARGKLPTCDGTTIYLPDALALTAADPVSLAAPLSGFAWYKVMAAHQVGHLEWGSFDYQHERAFPGEVSVSVSAAPRTTLTDYSRWLARFEQPQLARDLFAITEALRIDHRVLEAYPGLADVYRAARAYCLTQRRPRAKATAHEALVEWLLCASLNPDDKPAPTGRTRELATQAYRLLTDMREPGCRVEDAVVVTTRMYELLVPTDTYAALGDYKWPEPVLYRGAFKPELGQLLSSELDRHDVFPPETAHKLDRRKKLRDLVEHSSEVERAPQDIPEELLERSLTESLEDELSERGPPPPSSDDTADGSYGEDTALCATEPGTFVYEEWDSGDARYKPAFCMLYETRPKLRAHNDFFETTLQRHAALALRIRRRFEAMAAQLTRRELRQRDGEDLDLDATIDAVIDMRGGRTPSDRIHTRRHRRERDVAVAFLLDMSTSTGDPVEPGADRHARGTQRIIDLEKEALVLLAETLSVLGDRHGIYGFSGYGRKRVEFQVFKELHEPLGAEVKQRIGAIEPQSATRMGPAIRHVTKKLAAVQAKSRFLFLLSDGRPQDQGYGNHGASQRYAVEDTRAALVAADRAGITPFCLAIDKAGHEYLGAMMQGMRYEVLWDLAMLPQRLPELYCGLTRCGN